MNENLKTKVGKKILSIIESGVNPFKVPYSEDQNASYKNYPVNYLTGKIYNGINQFCVPAGYYLTFNQMKSLGGSINKGAKSYEIYYHSSVDKIVEDEKGLEKIKEILEQKPETKSFYWGTTYYFLNNADSKWYKSIFIDKKFNIFNIKDINNLKEIEGRFNKKQIETVFKKADDVINDYLKRENFTLEIGKEPTVIEDKIYIPHRNRFENDSDYYQVLFNTLSFSTQEKLNRKVYKIGSSSYSKEQLINEIAGILCVASVGLANEKCNANSGAYLKEWAKVIQGNNLEEKIWSCVTDAIRSYKHIFNLS